MYHGKPFLIREENLAKSFVIFFKRMLALDQVLRRTLVMFDHFWDFDRLVEDGAPRRSGDRGISPFWDFWVLGFM
jgi:hypothetical protein